MQGEDIGMAVVMGGILLGATAILGGIVSGIVRGYQRQRMVELAQRERIALIERGADPDKLPPLTESALVAAFGRGIGDERILAGRRKQGLVIAGLIFTFFGLALALMLGLLAGDHVWSVGGLPTSIGLALLVGARAVKAPVEA